MEEGKRISYFTLFSWILVVLFFFWCQGQIWSLRHNFGSTDTWELADFAYRVGVVIFLLVMSAAFSVGYVIFIKWLHRNYLEFEDRQESEREDFVDAERL